jgi:hypothetical protein
VCVCQEAAEVIGQAAIGPSLLCGVQGDAAAAFNELLDDDVDLDPHPRQMGLATFFSKLCPTMGLLRRNGCFRLRRWIPPSIWSM